MTELRTTDKDYYDSILIMMSPDGLAKRAETISFRESTTAGYNISLGNQALFIQNGFNYWFGNTDGFATRLQTSGDNYAFSDGFVFKHWHTAHADMSCSPTCSPMSPTLYSLLSNRAISRSYIILPWPSQLQYPNYNTTSTVLNKP